MAELGVTAALLERAAAGEPGPLDELYPRVMDELRGRAAWILKSCPPGYTLQPTALVGEAYISLQGEGEIPTDRTKFIWNAVRIMRNVNRAHQQRREAKKRGGDWKRLDIDDVPLAVEGGTVTRVGNREILAKISELLDQLEEADPQQAKIVELLYLVGLTQKQTAALLGIARETVRNKGDVALAWLRDQLIDSIRSIPVPATADDE